MFRLNKSYIPPLGFIVAFFMIWELAVHLTNIPEWLLPSPAQVLKALLEMFPILLEHTESTLFAALLGLIIAIIVALIFSLLMDISAWIKKGVYPLLIISQTIPIIAIAPLFIIWFGFGILPKVVVVALVCFFPIVVSMVQGMETADPDIVNLLHVMGASHWKTITIVKFPAALPSFFAGLKIAGTYAVMGAVIGEWLGAKNGLGVFMTRASYAYQLDRVLAAIIVISLLSLVLFFLIETSAKLFMPWYYKERRNL